MLKYKDIISDLERISLVMKSDKLEIDLVAYLGYKTSFLGKYFSDFFNCQEIEFPSLHRPNRSKFLANTLNEIYPILPESVLYILSKHFKKLYQKDVRVLKKNFDLKRVLDGYKSILLVDDNAFTGKTLEGWKKMIDKKVDIHTFSITVTGEYKPDYFCLEGWHSFEWRAIGI